MRPMVDESKPVPEPGEAQRDDDAVHYYEVDETNVGGTETSDSEPDDREQPGAAAAE
ncbi:hypothetical protein C8N24_0049 [Solirubrobacter pauli]|uniref:Uncharacterized protein n=2 Tax=Solirubrobacter pauli TaxID=166793 RepID=A0A660L8I2_9ACTN|nr:hypothetical protein C8N24_0049 [Solirubrobacter pauli]